MPELCQQLMLRRLGYIPHEWDVVAVRHWGSFGRF